MEMDHNLFNDPDGQWSMFQTHCMANVDPSQVWQSPDLTPDGFNAPIDSQSASKSAQSNIVSQRDQVTERFGQVTPPDDDAPDSPFDAPSKESSKSKRKMQEEDLAKQSRTQRARNAANKRHSKSKPARRDSTHDVESDVDEVDNGDGKSTNVQREKNRLAAAKCRAKKKATSEEMQESHREGSKQNSYLQREVRELRDQKAFLRNALLQHEPGVCQCHTIHRFNMAQAQQLALGVNAMIQPLSPSQDSVGSVLTPGSDISMGSRSTAAHTQSNPRKMSMSSRQQSYASQSNFNIGQMANGPPTYPPANVSPSNQSIPGPFADFLSSSPGGNGGFQ